MTLKTSTFICVALFSGLIITSHGFAQPLAFPGAEGAGAHAVGGRGGDVYYVTNLNDTGSGSLRTGIDTAPNSGRTIVFAVSGIITLNSDLTIDNDNITVAGQTAPGDGICLTKYPLKIKADDIIVRYIRVRLSDVQGQDDDDTVSIGNGNNIIMDHCSASWSIDETFSCSDDARNVTVQWCVISEPLDNSHHDKGAHGYCSLIRGHDGAEVSFHHNLFAHARSRMPRPGNYESYLTDPQGFRFDFRNNVIYNFNGSRPGINVDNDSITHHNFVNNYYKTGPDSSSPTSSNIFHLNAPYATAYFDGNILEGDENRDQWDLVSGEQESQRLVAPITIGGVAVTPQTAYEAYAAVLADVGASLARDDIDTRIINDVNSGTGGIIDSQTEVGGLPLYNSTTAPLDSDQDGMTDAWETYYGLNPNNASDRNDYDLDNDYTNLEVYLYQIFDGTALNAPPTWDSDPLAKDDANENEAYVDSLSGNATDPEAGGPLIFTKESGPAWLSIDPDGSLSGAPAHGDIGSGSWDVKATDVEGDSSTVVVTIRVLSEGDFNADGYVAGDDLNDEWKAGYGSLYNGSDFLNWQRHYTGPPIFVPDVVDINKVVAENTITAAGLSVGTTTTAYHPTIILDNVISSDPVAGVELLAGDSVSLVVSLGPSPFSPILINFQPAGSAVPAGYIKDDGAVYGDRGNGYTHGWVGGANNETRDRGIDADQRYDTLNHMSKNGDTTWEIELPNGDYTFTVLMGDPGFTDSVNDVKIEGIIQSDPNGAVNNFDLYTDLVRTVSDGKLTLTTVGGVGNNAKICYLDITGYVAPAPLAASSAAGTELPPAMLSSSSVEQPTNDTPAVPTLAGTDSTTSSSSPLGAAGSVESKLARHSIVVAARGGDLSLLIIKSRLRQATKEVRQGKTRRAERRLQELLSELNDMLSDTGDTDPQRKRIEQLVESVKKQLAKIASG